jgi:hypothetical protein
VCTVLDVVGRPKAFSRHIVSLVEQRVERLEDRTNRLAIINE